MCLPNLSGGHNQVLVGLMELEGNNVKVRDFCQFKQNKI